MSEEQNKNIESEHARHIGIARDIGFEAIALTLVGGVAATEILTQIPEVNIALFGTLALAAVGIGRLMRRFIPRRPDAASL